MCISLKAFANCVWGLLTAFICCILAVLKAFFASSEASNFGTLLTGLGTIGLIWLGWRGLDTLSRFKTQKGLEKKSDIAEESLNRLDMFRLQFFEWLRLASSAHIYSRDSEGNREKYNDADDKEKKALKELFENDPTEIRNFYKQGLKIIEIAISAKNHAARLNNQMINDKFNELEAVCNNQLKNLSIFHFFDSSGQKRAESLTVLSRATMQCEELLKAIYPELRNDLLFLGDEDDKNRSE